MIPKGKLFALVLIFAALIGAAGTGAFSTAEAERTANVTVDGDANALLGITPVQDPGDSSFIEQADTTSSEFRLDVTGDNDENAINVNASTTGQNLFNITNNGEQTVVVQLFAEGGLANNNSELEGRPGVYGEKVSTYFYVDSSNVTSASKLDDLNDNQGEGTGEDTINVSDDFNTLVSDDDLIISEEGKRDGTFDGDRAIEIESGESITVSVYTQVAIGDKNLELDGDEQVVETIGITASADEADSTYAEVK